MNNFTLKNYLKIVFRAIRPYFRRLIGDPFRLLEEMKDSPLLFRTYRMYLKTGHERVSGGWVYKNQFYPDYITVGGNSIAIQRIAQKYCRGIGVDIGAGFWPFPGSIPIDLETGEGVSNSLENIPNFSLDYVFSSHCLEHIEDWFEELKKWKNKIKPDGIIFLYLPHPSCGLWHQSNPMMAATHKWVPSPSVITSSLIDLGFEIIDRDDGPDNFFSFFVCAKKINDKINFEN